MSMIAKAGIFSDGGHRIRIVNPGYDADPIPSDTTQIVFDSDWPEVLMTSSSYFGSQSISIGSGSTATVTFTTLPFSPMVFIGLPGYGPTWSPSSALNTLLTNAYFLFGQSAGLFSSDITVTDSTIVYYNSGSSVIGTMLWLALLTDTTSIATTPPSRAGTQWMEWTADGPVVARPGKTISSTSLLDFLIPPVSLGATIGQPLLAASVSSLPVYDTYMSGSTHMANYVEIIPHGLGFVPVVIPAIGVSDFRISPALFSPYIWVDDTNIYITCSNSWSGTGSPPSTFTVAESSYFVLRERWV